VSYVCQRGIKFNFALLLGNARSKFFYKVLGSLLGCKKCVNSTIISPEFLKKIITIPERKFLLENHHTYFKKDIKKKFRFFPAR
jgi:hypothetical protein